jgi:hypothetical protein
MSSDKMFISGFILGAIFSYTGLLGFLAGIATGIVVMNNYNEAVIQTRAKEMQTYGMTLYERLNRYRTL